MSHENANPIQIGFFDEFNQEKEVKEKYWKYLLNTQHVFYVKDATEFIAKDLVEQYLIYFMRNLWRSEWIYLIKESNKTE